MNIYDVTLSELEDFFARNGENKAKATIVFKSVYRDRITDFSALGFGEKAKQLLSEHFSFDAIEPLETYTNEDAAKLLFRMADGNTIEAVLMRHSYGNGLCISTQVGCNMGCKFCESGRRKKIRDLTPGEMVLQYLTAERVLGVKITHLTLMGVGEPLDNLDNVLKFISIAGCPKGSDIAKRRITVSTSGLIPELRELMARNAVSNLAVSLHASNDDLRSGLMPINKVYGIDSLIDVIREYSADKNRKTAIEYVMLKGVNDSKKNALELAELLKGVYCYVNLIPYNETANSPYERSDAEAVSEFCRTLLGTGIRTTIRREFGAELKAACGQLR